MSVMMCVQVQGNLDSPIPFLVPPLLVLHSLQRYTSFPVLQVPQCLQPHRVCLRATPVLPQLRVRSSRPPKRTIRPLWRTLSLNRPRPGFLGMAPRRLVHRVLKSTYWPGPSISNHVPSVAGPASEASYFNHPVPRFVDVGNLFRALCRTTTSPRPRLPLHGPPPPFAS